VERERTTRSSTRSSRFRTTVAAVATVALVGLVSCAPPSPPPPPPPPPWAASTRITAAGDVATDVGCAASNGAADLAAFFRQRIGPVLGWDYQHVYPLGPDRWLWLFQDAFIDHPGLATSLDGVGFAHNAALLQTGTCFTLLHRGTAAQPSSFEPGDGEVVLSRWWWPLGGERDGGVLRVFWAEMVHDGAEPPAGDGLPWHPVQTWLATYDATDLTRLGFVPAPGPTPSGPKPPPLYGYAVASDDSFTYLFGNTYQQNLTLEGGFWDGPHSATDMWLARVPRGRLDERPKYWTGTGWAQDPSKAEPIDSRYWTENPMQPHFVNGRWVAVTKENGFWGQDVAVSVATDPWGPWTTVQQVTVDDDPILNTYGALAVPWLTPDGSLIVSLSRNARDMRRDAYPVPARYRPTFLTMALPSAAAAAAASGTRQPPSVVIPEQRENRR
jgi:hypothetical protein